MVDDSWDPAYRNGEYRHWELEHPSPELAALVAAGVFKEGSRVLDVGCGAGLDAIYLAKYGFRVTGVDSSKVALGIAERRARKARIAVDWRLGSVLELPVEDGTMDIVTDRGLFHVIEDVDRPRYASEVDRVLKLGGLVVIRGAGKEVGRDRFIPVTERAIDDHFPAPKFKRGPVVALPLYSIEGGLSSRIVVLKKRRR